jgi:site-specific recombinase XerD
VERLERPLLVKWLERAQRRAQLKVTGRLHALRHTFCAHLSMCGAPVMAIKELAGHRQISTTVGYMHLSPAAKESAIRLLDGSEFGNRLATSSETGTESTKSRAVSAE